MVATRHTLSNLLKPARKPVILALVIFYSYFVLVQTLPEQWFIRQACVSSLPPFFYFFGMHHSLILFSKQTSENPQYVFLIHFSDGVILNWSYPDENPLIVDRPMYNRLLNMYMERAKRTRLSEDFAIYLARKFDTPDRHPTMVECRAVLQKIPKADYHGPVRARVEQIFAYKISATELNSSYKI